MGHHKANNLNRRQMGQVRQIARNEARREVRRELGSPKHYEAYRRGGGGKNWNHARFNSRPWMGGMFGGGAARAYARSADCYPKANWCPPGFGAARAMARRDDDCDRMQKYDCEPRRRHGGPLRWIGRAVGGTLNWVGRKLGNVLNAIFC